MRTLAAVATATLFATGLASAQMKATQPSSPAAPPVQIAQPAPKAQTLPPLESARRIEREEAIKLVKEKKAVFVDVRGKDSYDTGHIAGAVSIPLQDLMVRLKELPPGKMIITYCAWQQEHTSARAVLDLNAHGVKNTACLVGGWNDWQKAGLATETTPVKK